MSRSSATHPDPQRAAQRSGAEPHRGRAAALEEARARAEAALREREDLLSSLEDGVLLLDADGRVAWLNPAAEELTGLSRAQVAGRSLAALFPPPASLAALAARTLSAGRPHADYEVSVLRADGSRLSLSAVASEVRTPQGDRRGAVLVLRDLSRVRELERRAQRADHLAALGVLAAGLAHEVRNPLVGIRAAAQLLQQEAAFPPALAEFPQVIIREVDRLNRLVDELLAFAGPRPLRAATCNINQLVEDALRLQAPALEAAGIHLVRRYDPAIPPVVAEADRLMQVFLNLARNAAEATAAGGTVTVRTRFERVAPACAGRAAAVVEIEDTGAGLSGEVLAQMFTPFFTTKDRGTGLGLPLSLRIVEEHGGALEARSRDDGGALFRVLLPLEPPGGGAQP